MSEYSKSIAYKKDWITRLESEIAELHEGWAEDTKDGARVCAAVLFPNWSPKLGKLRLIHALKKEIYGTLCEETLNAWRAVEDEKGRIASGNVDKINAWPKDRLNAAANNFFTVCKDAGKIR